MELEVDPRVRALDGYEEAAGTSRPVPVDHEGADDLAHRDGGDGEVVTAQPEHRVADALREDDGDHHARQHPAPRREVQVLQEERRGVGARAEEDGVAE